MDIPDTLTAWAACMREGTDDQQQCLQNLEDDPCVPDNAAELFFRELASKVRADASVAESAAQADSAAFAVVADNADALTCTGTEVPQDRFERAFRLETPDALRFRLPEAVLRERGIRSNDLTNDELSADELRALTDEYDGEVALGNRIGIVWTAELPDAGVRTIPVDELRDRLGLDVQQHSTTMIYCEYERARTGEKLHVPRVLDAIGNPRFRPVQDCEAPAGATRPLTLTDGFPEAVHRACNLVPTRWELIS